MEEAIYYTLQEYYNFTKDWAYIFMGVTVVSMLAWWMFLTGRDED